MSPSSLLKLPKDPRTTRQRERTKTAKKGANKCEAHTKLLLCLLNLLFFSDVLFAVASLDFQVPI